MSDQAKNVFDGGALRQLTELVNAGLRQHLLKPGNLEAVLAFLRFGLTFRESLLRAADSAVIDRAVNDVNLTIEQAVELVRENIAYNSKVVPAEFTGPTPIVEGSP